MSKRTLIAISIAVVVIALGIGIWSIQKRAPKYTGPVEPVTIAFAKTPLAALVAIADAQGYFADQGLNVTTKEFKGGKQALVDGLLAGEADLATVADVPIAANSFTRENFKVLATIGSSDNELRIVARRDRAIAQPWDLRGKHLAAKQFSSTHFFLHLFLLGQGLTTDDITLTFEKNGSALVSQLESGEIDAFSHREPFIGEAKNLLGENAIVFEEPGLYLETFNLVAANDFIENNTAAVERFIMALIKAETFTKEHKDQAIRIVADKIGSTESAIRALWPDIVLSVYLNQVLLLSFEDEARWMISNNFTDKTEVPNYLNYVYTDALEAVKPNAMTIIK